MENVQQYSLTIAFFQHFPTLIFHLIYLDIAIQKFGRTGISSRLSLSLSLIREKLKMDFDMNSTFTQRITPFCWNYNIKLLGFIKLPKLNMLKSR